MARRYHSISPPVTGHSPKDRRRNKTGRDAKAFFVDPRRNPAEWSKLHEQDSNVGSEEKCEQIVRN
ncbi:MAG: hypothetical protein AAGJ31_09180, partial [Verrucomicrobiota bacterium]